MPRIQVNLPPSVFNRLKAIAELREQPIATTAAVILEVAIEDFEKKEGVRKDDAEENID